MRSSFSIRSEELEEPMRKVFASYHFCKIENPLIQGFGNFVGQFNIDAYKDRLEEFIIHLEKHLKELLSSQLKFEVQVKVLFFK